MVTDSQLSFDDAEPVHVDVAARNPRFGETASSGYLLLELLNLLGWDVVVTTAFAGEGVLVIARGAGGIEVKRQGPSVADVAADLYMEAMRMPRPQPRVHERSQAWN